MIKENPAAISEVLSQELDFAVLRLKNTRTRQSILRWLSNFKGNDYLLALELLMDFVFVSEIDLIAECERLVASVNLEIDPGKKIFFRPVAKYGKSATLLSYYFMKSTTLKELMKTGRASFLQDLAQLRETQFDTNTVVVFFDDFFGSGGSLMKSIRHFKSNTNSTRKKIDAIFGVCIYYTKQAEENIKNRYPYIRLIGNVHDKHFDTIPLNYPTNAQMIKCKDILGRYAKENFLFYSRGINHHLGYQNSQSNISFPYMPPNNTLPIIWSGKSGWKPLIPRDVEDIIFEVGRLKTETAYAAAKLRLEVPEDIDIPATYTTIKQIVFGILRLRNSLVDFARIAKIMSLSVADLDKFIDIAVNLGYLSENKELTSLGKSELDKLIAIIKEKKLEDSKKLPFKNIKYVPQENSRE